MAEGPPAPSGPVTIDPIWCVVANVRAEAFGNATSPGTKHFRAGALLWILAGYWGDGGERVQVIGRHRGSQRLVALVEEAARLTNWRAKAAYHPVIGQLVRAQGWRDWGSREACERAAAGFARVHPPTPSLRDEIAVRRALLALLERDADGRTLERLAASALAAWTPQLRQQGVVPPIEVYVLGDWLEEHGVAIGIPELIRTLDRRRAPPL